MLRVFPGWSIWPGPRRRCFDAFGGREEHPQLWIWRDAADAGRWWSPHFSNILPIIFWQCRMMWWLWIILILYYTVLYYTILCHSTFYHIISYHIILSHIILYYIVLYYIAFHYITLNYIYIYILQASGGIKCMLLESLTKHPSISISVSCGSHFQVHFVWQVWAGQISPGFKSKRLNAFGRWKPGYGTAPC